ncbi:hypothetical protein FDZ71_02015, partial [bacterium]
MLKRLSLLIIFALAALWSAQAFAVGTAAGTSISNTAAVTYYDYNGTQIEANKLSNTVTTTVNQVASVDVATTKAADSAVNEATILYPVSIENLGNGNDTFDFTVNSASTNFSPTVTVYNDANGNGAIDV